MARTNIVLDDELLRMAQRITGLRTKRQIVEAALRELVGRAQRRRLLEFEGKLDWKGDLDSLRERMR
ncbi:MAG: type II toxin-antitoxin system VapB family antitoxin [Candidatus Riflebacteria bacterium]|nr:type II toxin-antitoxin system VapB family antitoxin [Candidatus Riflebacteria bacterium]